MYYTIASVTPQEVRLDLKSKYLNLGKHVFSFVFDNSKGAIKLIQDASEQTVAWIPYEDIDYFDIIKKTSSGGNNNHYYDVIMHLKSFASWPLFQLGYLNNAEEELSKLKAGIDLNKKASFIDKPVLPSDVVTATHNNGKTILKWRNSSRTSDAVKLALIGIGVGALLVYLLQMMFSQSIFGFLVLLVFLAIYLVAMYKQTTTLMKDHVTEYGFSFSPNEVEYFEDAISPARRKLTSIIPRTNWRGLSYPITGLEQDVILSINGDSVKQYYQLVRNKGSIKELYNASKETLTSQRLRMKDLHPVQRVNVVNWIRAEINKNTQSA